MRSFGSDNHSGIHPEVLQAVIEANADHAVSYGDDDITRRAEVLFQRHFGEKTRFFPVFTGTAANTLAVKAFAESWQSVICADTSHINVDECGAPENFTGCKVQTVKTPDGKIKPAMLEPFLDAIGFEHHSQPRVVSITQSTELGTVYRPDEVAQIADFAHAHGMILHMDGARIANAAASLGLPLAAISSDCGVDVLSFGGTKNGLMGGEAVLFFNTEPVWKFPYIRKQGMQLASKMRFISAQLIALLSDDLWLRNAGHANRMARLLAQGLTDIPAVKLVREPEVNAVFAIIPREIIEPLQQRRFFYVWDEAGPEVRWMTTFDTTDADIEGFINDLKLVLSEHGI